MTDGEEVPQQRSAAVGAAVGWLREHGDYLFSYAVARVATSDEAEDLVQETLLGAMQSFDQFEQRASIRTWLTSILRHKLFDHRRQRARDRGTRSPSERLSDEAALEQYVESRFRKRGIWKTVPASWPSSGDPLELLQSQEFRQVLLDCLDKLPPRPAEAIDLVERGGMSLEQVSHALGVTATNAGVILHRARLALRDCLEHNWFRDP